MSPRARLSAVVCAAPLGLCGPCVCGVVFLYFLLGTVHLFRLSWGSPVFWASVATFLASLALPHQPDSALFLQGSDLRFSLLVLDLCVTPASFQCRGLIPVLTASGQGLALDIGCLPSPASKTFIFYRRRIGQQSGWLLAGFLGKLQGFQGLDSLVTFTDPFFPCFYLSSLLCQR